VANEGGVEQVGEPAYPSARDRRAKAIAAQAYHSATLLPVRVVVDAGGQPTACVVQSAATEAFRQAACQSLAGPYQPALDAAGQPAPGLFQIDMR
jgi:hypothetical protein